MPYRPNFPIPEDIHAEPFCLCIQVPNDPTWKQVVAGLLDELNQWYNWQRNEEKSGKDCAQVWRGLYEQIDWTTMSCCCDDLPVQFRYTVDGVLQRSTDGGTTWEDAPDYDPRNNSTIFPPMPGDDSPDKKCLAATGAVDLIKQQVGDNLTDDMTRYTLAQLINDWITTYLQSSNPFEALMTIIANQIFALVIAVVRPALTDSVYEILKCIFYCDAADDASVNDTQWAQIRSDITDQIGGVAGIFLEHLVYLLGSRGMTNLMRASGATEGDCSTCHCDETWCLDVDFTVASFDDFIHSYEPSSNPAVYNTLWTFGSGWQTANSDPNYSALQIKLSDYPGLRYISFVATGDDLGFIADGMTEHGDPDHTNYGSFARTLDGTETYLYIMFGRRSRAVITSMHLSGVGLNPFGANNC